MTLHSESLESEPVPQRVKRVELDYYPTPAWVVDAIKPYLPRASVVLDPACGIGELIEALKPDEGHGIELDPGRANEARRCAWVDTCKCADALSPDTPWREADLALMNPPFSHARQFIERAMDWRSEDKRRTVACLARLTILESEERRSLHATWPADVYVLAKRPSFGVNRFGKPATDSVTACWLVWGPGRGGRWQVL